MFRISLVLLAALSLGGPSPALAADMPPLALEDVFSLEHASDPRIAPEGGRIAYVRNFMDRMTDKARGELWIISDDGSRHRPLVTGLDTVSSPRWSPDADRIAFVGVEDGDAQIWVRWMTGGHMAPMTRLSGKPENLAWSPDGEWIAFTMRVPKEVRPLATLPNKPDGAEWADPVEVIDSMIYRADGKDLLGQGNTHVFVVPAEGGTARQLTQGDFEHDGGLSWLPNSRSLVISANRRDDWEHEPLDTDLWVVDLEDGAMRRLTDRYGPDSSPAVSPDGRRIAYVGFDDERLGYHNAGLYLMNRDTREVTLLTGELDRSVRDPAWDSRGRGIYFLYDDEGATKLARLELSNGQVATIAENVGGVTLGRPYASGSFTVATYGSVAYTQTGPDRPADVATGDGRRVRRLTRLNDDLLGQRELGRVESFWVESSYDQRDIQAWLMLPPGFDPSLKYPLIVEIHGGPYANYGPRFSAEVQLYAAAGYVVLYANPRGSTSYGAEFANLIENNYPGEDYDDLMSAVNAALARGFLDPGRLYVTGGSGGGVLTAWIVGKTDRFRAAAVAKPVINWTSFALTADRYNFFYRYWFPGPPWEHQAEYWRRSPLSLVGQVNTPTMVLTGEQDWRTPMSESEQYYQALKLRGVDTVLVRVTGASHSIAKRPTQLMAKVANILAWFERYPDPRPARPEAAPAGGQPAGGQPEEGQPEEGQPEEGQPAGDAPAAEDAADSAQESPEPPVPPASEPVEPPPPDSRG
jgi:acylaminoacyl-peptidase